MSFCIVKLDVKELKLINDAVFIKANSPPPHTPEEDLKLKITTHPMTAYTTGQWMCPKE